MSTIYERWEYDDGKIEVLTPCVTCKHRRDGPTCDAFPKGIPQVVLLGEEQHRTPLPGDNGIQYEAK